MAVEVIHGETATAGLLAGAKKIYDTVRITLGPKGRNVILKELRGGAFMTNDGVTIARQVALGDEVEDAGAKLVIQAATLTNEHAGDGTTATVILAYNLLQKGLEKVRRGMNVVALQHSLEKYAQMLERMIYETATQLDHSELKKVAMISANDERLGEVIAEAIEYAGPDGGVIVEERSLPGIEWKKEEGISLPMGLIHPDFFANDPIGRRAIYDDIPVIIADQKISSMRQLLPLVTRLGQIMDDAGAPINRLLVIANDFAPHVLADIIQNMTESRFYILPLIAPGGGDVRSALLRDYASVVDCEVIVNVSELRTILSDSKSVGYAKRVESRRGKTVILGGRGNLTEATANRIRALKEEMKEVSDEFLQNSMKDRIATLSSKISLIAVGATTPIGLMEMKYRIEDAVNSCRAALDKGVVAGGGVCLHNLSFEGCNKLGASSPEELAAVEILRDALTKPYAQILENAGAKLSQKGVQIPMSDGYGYDAKGDMKAQVFMLDAGIVDPARVVAEEVLNSVGVAAALLTAGAIIIQKSREAAEVLRGIKALKDEE